MILGDDGQQTALRFSQGRERDVNCSGSLFSSIFFGRGSWNIKETKHLQGWLSIPGRCQDGLPGHWSQAGKMVRELEGVIPRVL